MPVRKTNKQFLRDVFEETKDEYIFLEKYINSKVKLLVRHNKCGIEYKVRPGHFLNSGSRCPNCFKQNRNNKIKKPTKQFKKEVVDLVGNEYTFFGEYRNRLKEMEVKHNVCGNKYEVKPSNFLAGSKCPSCYPRKRGPDAKTNEEFVEEIKCLVDDEYTFLETYIRSGRNIKIKHNTCGHEYSVQPNAFILGSRCPRCSKSKGEKRISGYLDKLGLHYTPEQTFSDLKDNGLLRYDFSIRDSKNNITHLIEYDGIQHYQPIDFFGGKAYFQETQYKDDLKNNYAKENNIPLLRIPYWDFENIQSLVGDFLELAQSKEVEVMAK